MHMNMHGTQEIYKIQFAAFSFKCFSSLKVAVFLTECLYCSLH